MSRPLPNKQRPPLGPALAHGVAIRRGLAEQAALDEYPDLVVVDGTYRRLRVDTVVDDGEGRGSVVAVEEDEGWIYVAVSWGGTIERYRAEADLHSYTLRGVRGPFVYYCNEIEVVA